MFSAVELRSPHMMTIAIGAWISLPGSPADNAIGTNANPAARAVIRIGTRRSVAPRITAVAEICHAFVLLQVPDVRHEHDAVPCCDAEQRDEANDRRDRQHAASQIDARHTADERKR